jgi:hypothetical protein
MFDEDVRNDSERGGGMIKGSWDAEVGEGGMVKGLVDSGVDGLLVTNSPSALVQPLKATEDSGYI